MEKTKVGILGATGMVGQRFIALLAEHPWFEITEVAASEKSAGKSYAEAVKGRWKIETQIPEKVAGMEVKECKAKGMGCELVFGALDAEIAKPIEQEFAKAGMIVSSNTKTHRMEADVPLLIPEVNAEHLEVIERQRKNRGWRGAIITNPNCTLMGPTITAKALDDAFGVKKMMVFSMQALSGAGYPGVPSLDIVDNVMPFIGGEEPKVESEPLKILGKLGANGFENAKITISAHCNRVGVTNGHTTPISVELAEKPSIDEVKKAFREFRGEPQKLKLPTAPQPVIVVREEDDRPQPRMDRDAGKGMAITVGRVRACRVLGYKFTAVSHNTVRGAAGAAILNAELMKAKGYL
ncbi:MAG: aspartate-semialdehyde dehydrogenase [Candidatus Diapherotrites archaeon]